MEEIYKQIFCNPQIYQPILDILQSVKGQSMKSTLDTVDWVKQISFAY